MAAAAAALVLVVVVRVIGRRTRLRSLCCGQLSLCRRLFTVAAAVAAGKIRLLLCRRGNNSASSASLAAFAGPRAPREDGGLPPSADACRARRATGTSRGAPERCACVRACEWRWVEWFSGLPGSCARSARDFFFSPLQKRVRLLWISCVSGSLTGVFEVSSAARTAFLLKSFVWIGSVFSPEPGTRHARILLFWCL